MLTVANMGEGGVKNCQKSADVLYGRPPTQRSDIIRGRPLAFLQVLKILSV